MEEPTASIPCCCAGEQDGPAVEARASPPTAEGMTYLASVVMRGTLTRGEPGAAGRGEKRRRGQAIHQLFDDRKHGRAICHVQIWPPSERCTHPAGRRPAGRPGPQGAEHAVGTSSTSDASSAWEKKNQKQVSETLCPSPFYNGVATAQDVPAGHAPAGGLCEARHVPDCRVSIEF